MGEAVKIGDADSGAKEEISAPDFVIELRSPSDHLSDLQNKMQEYIDNGVQLGWLIDPEGRRVYVYQPGQPIACLT